MVGKFSDRTRSSRASRYAALLLAVLLAPSCSGSDSGQPLLTAEMPLHLEEHLDAATIVGSEVRADLRQSVEWRFDEPQPDWKPVVTLEQWSLPQGFALSSAEITRADDALHLVLGEDTGGNDPAMPAGGIYVELPEWELEDWDYVLVKARTETPFAAMSIGLNLWDESEIERPGQDIENQLGETVEVIISDGSVQSYMIRIDSLDRTWRGPWRQLALLFGAQEPGSIDILSLSVIPKEATYSAEAAGAISAVLDKVHRRALYTHTPARIAFRVRVPGSGRLDMGLGAVRADGPVTFRVLAESESRPSEELFEEEYSDGRRWTQRSVDLSSLAGETVTLALETDAERPGTVALWATPTVSGARNTGKPNIVLYVIDGGGAEYMSVYGYNRRTTPNLERLAAEGALFEHAYSNAFWSGPSTTSFMTSLRHSVLGGFRSNRKPMPKQAVTMAQHVHDAGYQTAVFTGNPLAGRRTQLDRGVDALRDEGMWGDAAPSSIALHQEFWRWREAFPGQPFWVHFQTVDVHNQQRGVLLPPFSGLYLEPARRAEYLQWVRQVGRWGFLELFEEAGVDRLEFYDRVQRQYSEGMASQDHQIGKLVERLKRTGEWSNTLFIVAADHGQFETGLVQLEPYPPYGQHTNLRPERTRVPMIFVWQGHIAGGQRFTDPVSMIDMLPTVLDLADLPPPEVMQGQSLAPLLLGTGGWEPRPVILDEFYVDSESGELRGWLEVIDGRWGASLAINPHPEGLSPPDAAGYSLPSRFIVDRRGERPAPLLIYDLWNDPYCLNSLHEERPDLVEKYTELLEAQWAANQVLAQRFPQAER